jgi:hypothetical protein
MGFFSRFFGPPTEDQFARLFQRTLAQVGSKRVTAYDKENFRLTHDDGFTNLRNFYIEYCKLSGRERGAYLSRCCLLTAQAPEAPLEFEDVRPDLLPTVRSRGMLEDMRLQVEAEGGDWAGLPSTPLSEHLEVCLVYDLAQAMRFVNREMLEEWGVTIYEAMEVAKQNLEQRESVLVQIGERLYLFSTGDAYDASRMLMTEKICKLEFQGVPVALPITRESLLLTGSDDEAGLAMMAELAETMRAEARPICPIAHRLVDKEWEPWTPAVDSAGHDKLRLLALQFMGGQYTEQKGLLEKVHARDGTDVFVASVMSVERQGKAHSFSFWSKGVVTWLPHTEYVGVADHEAKITRFVRWEQLQTQVGHLMRPLEMYPPRWLVEDFPTPEQVEAMQGEDWSK